MFESEVVLYRKLWQLCFLPEMPVPECVFPEDHRMLSAAKKSLCQKFFSDFADLLPSAD
jgi:hypothetical protein